MKYLVQFGVIAMISLVAEMLHAFLPLPIPASVYGIMILFLLLQTKVVKLKQVEEVADFFLIILPILFLAPSVGLMDTIGSIQDSLLKLSVIIILSTLATMIVTGVVAHSMIVKRKKKGD